MKRSRLQKRLIKSTPKSFIGSAHDLKFRAKWVPTRVEPIELDLVKGRPILSNSNENSSLVFKRMHYTRF